MRKNIIEVINQLSMVQTIIENMIDVSAPDNYGDFLPTEYVETLIDAQELISSVISDLSDLLFLSPLHPR